MQSSTDTLKKKIFIETSALVAASVHLTLSEGNELEDEFYQESVQLFNILTKHFNSRIGITSKTVEREARKILEQVVISTLHEKTDEPFSFAAKSYHWNRCQARMDQYLTILSIEPAPKEHIQTLEDEIAKMYQALADGAKPNWKLNEEAEEEVKGRAVPPRILNASPKYVQEIQKEEVQTIYLQKVCKNLQTSILVHHFPSREAIQVLSEAVLIYRHLTANDPKLKMLLASCDPVNFSPMFSKEYGLCTTVTDTIQSRFKIRCERPMAITALLKEELEPQSCDALEAASLNEDNDDETGEEREDQD